MYNYTYNYNVHPIIIIDLDVCGHTEPCQSWELCTNTGPDSHRCEALIFSGEMPASGDDIDMEDDRSPENSSTEDHTKENSTNSSRDNKSSTLDIVSKGKCFNNYGSLYISKQYH